MIYIADHGDSGSAVFDEDGNLWGIVHGIALNGRLAVVIPIHAILHHVQEKFEVRFRLI